jgi:hypothetical protein
MMLVSPMRERGFAGALAYGKFKIIEKATKFESPTRTLAGASG